MRLPVIVILPLGLLAVSTASIFVRMVPDLPAITIAFWRMAIASAILWAITMPGRPTGLSSTNRGRVIIAGILLFCCVFCARCKEKHDYLYKKMCQEKENLEVVKNKY